LAHYNFSGEISNFFLPLKVAGPFFDTSLSSPFVNRQVELVLIGLFSHLSAEVNFQTSQVVFNCLFWSFFLLLYSVF